MIYTRVSPASHRFRRPGLRAETTEKDVERFASTVTDDEMDELVEEALPMLIAVLITFPLPGCMERN